jgi:hypothetical protein
VMLSVAQNISGILSVAQNISGMLSIAQNISGMLVNNKLLKMWQEMVTG